MKSKISKRISNIFLNFRYSNYPHDGINLKEDEKKLGKTQIFFILFGLTFLFIIDDVLFLILVDLLHLFTISKLAWLFLSVVIFLLNFFMAVMVFSVFRKKPSTGMDGMVGRTGIAIRKFRDAGTVIINGEIWQAESDEMIAKKERIRVISINGLTLKVIKLKS